MKTENKTNIKIFEVTILDLSGLGGPMGTERVTTTDSGFFINIDNAKKYCEKYYGKLIKWKKCKSGLTSGDLGYCMMNIDEIKFLD